MDAKISEFPTTATLSVADIIPIVANGDNKSITVGAFALNLPNLGNKGITKNAVVTVTGGAIPLTGTVVSLLSSPTPYSLSSGSGGQTIILIASGDLTVQPEAFGNQKIGMTRASSVTLMFITSIGQWVCLSQINCTFMAA